jgi:hypothetical protein
MSVPDSPALSRPGITRAADGVDWDRLTDMTAGLRI